MLERTWYFSSPDSLKTTNQLAGSGPPNEKGLNPGSVLGRKSLIFRRSPGPEFKIARTACFSCVVIPNLSSPASWAVADWHQIPRSGN